MVINFKYELKLLESYLYKSSLIYNEMLFYKNISIEIPVLKYLYLKKTNQKHILANKTLALAIKKERKVQKL